MIHYHGAADHPATQRPCALLAATPGIEFVSSSGTVDHALEVAQSFAVGNGAFSAWRSGKLITDWSYCEWVGGLHPLPGRFCGNT